MNSRDLQGFRYVRANRKEINIEHELDTGASEDLLGYYHGPRFLA